jgi:hypothetical protein
VKEAGGVHIIQTFIGEEQAEEIQMQSTGARQGQRGSYEMIISDHSLQSLHITMDFFDGKSPQDIETILQGARNTVFEK